jgi:uncharacterized membrane protein
MTLTLLALQLLSTLFMTGVIWFVQIVHYPLMRHVPREAFQKYEHHHQRATTWVVAPAMLVELFTAIGLVVVLEYSAVRIVAAANLALAVGIWLSTFLGQMPIHQRLAQEYQAGLIDRLVRTNWVRSGLWGVRSVLVLWIAYNVTE